MLKLRLLRKRQNSFTNTIDNVLECYHPRIIDKVGLQSNAAQFLLREISILKFEITIPIIPKPWTVRRGRTFYNVNQDYIQHVRHYIRDEYIDKPLSCPIYLDLVHYMPIPKSISKKARQDYVTNKVYHLKKPDTTNLNKQMEDCLTGIIWEDDCQVIKIRGTKLYAEEPRTVIKVYEYKTED